MPFVAIARLTIAATPEACIERLRDFSSWSRWMPDSFHPLTGPERPFVIGDVFKVRIRGVPVTSSLRVVQYEPTHAIAWTGGVPSVLHAVHAFHAEAQSDGTMVVSEETWSGALAEVSLVRRRVRTMAERIGAAQLAALAKDLVG